jgi:hypothetical protein
MNDQVKPETNRRQQRVRFLRQPLLAISEKTSATKKRVGLLLNRVKSCRDFTRHGHSDKFPKQRQNGCLSALRPKLLTNGGCGSTQRPEKSDGHSIDVLMKMLESRRTLHRPTNSLPFLKEKCPSRAAFERFHNEEEDSYTVDETDVSTRNSNKAPKAKTISKISTMPTLKQEIMQEKRGNPKTGKTTAEIPTCPTIEKGMGKPKRRDGIGTLKMKLNSADSCTCKLSHADVAADDVTTYNSNKAPMVENISNISTIKQEQLGILKRRGSSGTFNSADSCTDKSIHVEVVENDTPSCRSNKEDLVVKAISGNTTIEQEKRIQFERRGSMPNVTTRTLSSDCCPERAQRPKLERRSSSKRLLKALGVSDSKSFLLDVPEGLDSGYRRAEDIFPAPRTMLNPYEEDKKFIDGLVFFAPKSEDSIRSMLGHPAKRFMSPSRRPRSTRIQSI